MRKVLTVIFAFLILFAVVSCSAGNDKDSAKDKKIEKIQKKEVKDLNSWFKHKYYDENNAEYEKDGNQYFGSEYFMKEQCVNGFKVQNGQLTVLISEKNLKEYNLTQNDIASYAFNVVLSDYPGKIEHFKNLNKNAQLSVDDQKHPEYYSELETY